MKLRSRSALAVLVLDHSDRIVGWNAGASVMFGISVADAINGTKLSNLFVVDRQFEEVLKAIRSGAGAEVRALCKSKMGAVTAARIEVTPFCESDRAAGASLAISAEEGSDVSSPAPAAPAGALEQLMQLGFPLVELSHDVFWVCDSACTRTLYVTPSFTELTGVRFEELYRNPGLFLELIHAADRPRVLEAYEAARQRGECNIPEIECRILRPDGVVRWMWIRTLLLRDAAGATDLVLGVARDVTHYHQSREALAVSEEKLKSVMNSVNAILWSRCSKNKLEYVSAASNEVMGYTADELLADPTIWDEAILPEDRALISNLRDGYGKVQSQSQEFRIRHADGSVRWIHTRSRSSFAPDGTLLRVDGIDSDVTDRKTIEAALLESKRIAHEASKMKSQFLAVVSHEIRNPIAGVIGMIELLEKSRLDAKQRKYVASLNRASETLMHILNDILDFSKVEAGKLTLAMEPIDLRLLLATLEADFKARARAKKTKLESKFSSDLPRLILGDAARLRQLLENLIGNAVKFTSAGRIVIRVSRGKKRQGSTLVLVIQDTGCGIEKDAQAKVFEPFAQARLSDSTRHNGTGLGLSISKSIVELMGGTIGFDSKPGFGTTFTIVLPVKEIRTAAAHKKSMNARLLNPSGADGALVRQVLIAEDDPVMQEVLSANLHERGCRVELVANGLKAIEAVREKRGDPFDLILMDCEMPLLDGCHATHRIRALEREWGARKTPIVAVTAGGTLRYNRETILAWGMDDYLPKPFQVRALAKVVEKWLSGGELRLQKKS